MACLLWLQFATILWLLFFSIVVKAYNQSSCILFKFIPFCLAVSQLIMWAALTGFVKIAE